LKVGNSLRKRLAASQVNLDNGESITLSVSVGVAMLENGESLENLLARSNEAMYKAKQEGRDRVCCAPHNNRVY